MDLSAVSQYLVPAVTAAAALVTLIITTRKNAVLRKRIKEDTEILSALKDGTAAHTAMTSHIEWEIAELREAETVGERQWPFGIFALVCTAALTGASMWRGLQGGWTRAWLVLTVPFTLVFIYGMVESFAKLPRDEKGNTIREKKNS